MKPIRLTICGWGPYKGKQEIDFTGLEKEGFFDHRAYRRRKNYHL